MRRQIAAVCVAVFVWLCPQVAQASVINVGTLSFDALLEATANGPGVNGFGVGNLTGDAALDPDFLVLDLVFLNSARLTVSFGGFSPYQKVYELGNIQAGFLDPFANPALLVPSDVVVLQMLLEATLSTNLLHLLNQGGSVSVDPAVYALLLPIGGGGLAAGDLAVVSVNAIDSPAAVPEPGTLLLLATGAVAGAVRRFRGRLTRS